MAKTQHIELPSGELTPILHEDRSVLAIDKPPGWMLAPVSWRENSRNLQEVLVSSVRAGDFWARSRNLRRDRDTLWSGMCFTGVECRGARQSWRCAPWACPIATRSRGGVSKLGLPRRSSCANTAWTRRTSKRNSAR